MVDKHCLEAFLTRVITYSYSHIVHIVLAVFTSLILAYEPFTSHNVNCVYDVYWWDTDHWLIAFKYLNIAICCWVSALFFVSPDSTPVLLLSPHLFHFRYLWLRFYFSPVIVIYLIACKPETKYSLQLSFLNIDLDLSDYLSMLCVSFQ